MPHKHNTKGRHHISKMRYVLTNWPQYEAGLRRRGSLMLWITQDAIDAWAATRRPTPGGQPIYSDSAIQPCLMLRTAFELALRQAEGLTLSVVELLCCELAVPDQTIVSRRAAGLESITCGPLPRGPLHVLIDSTGLKVFGAGQWLSEKHMHSRRQWRKLHLGVDAGSRQIVTVTLTEQDLSDGSQVGPLLAQIQSPIEQLTADGAYDGEPTYRTIAAHGDATAVALPPRQDAVPSAGFEIDPSPRDTHFLMISSLGRLRSQEITGYGKRALVETAIGRYKALIGERRRCRGDAARRTEAVIGAAVLNCMLDAARPNSVRRSVIKA